MKITPPCLHQCHLFLQLPLKAIRDDHESAAAPVLGTRGGQH
jgi:hypothetical protein